MHQNLRPYQRWSGVGGDQAPALLGNLSVRLQFHIIQQIMGASLLEDLYHVFENDDEDIFVPAGLRAPYDWVLCLSSPPPPLSRAARANHHSVLHILSVFIRTCTCKTIRSQNILYFTFWLFLSAPFPLVPLLLQNHPFTKHTVFHILSVFHTFDPPILLSSQSHLQSHAKRNPEPTLPTISVRVILRCWGNSSILCQQNSDAL